MGHENQFFESALSAIILASIIAGLLLILLWRSWRSRKQAKQPAWPWATLYLEAVREAVWDTPFSRTGNTCFWEAVLPGQPYHYLLKRAAVLNCSYDQDGFLMEIKCMNGHAVKAIYRVRNLDRRTDEQNSFTLINPVPETGDYTDTVGKISAQEWTLLVDIGLSASDKAYHLFALGNLAEA